MAGRWAPTHARATAATPIVDLEATGAMWWIHHAKAQNGDIAGANQRKGVLVKTTTSKPLANTATGPAATMTARAGIGAGTMIPIVEQDQMTGAIVLP